MEIRVHKGSTEGAQVAVATFTRRTYADRDAVTGMFEDLCEKIRSGEFRNLVLNGSQLEYVASATLGKLMTLSRLTNQAGGQLKLCCLEPQFHDILRTTRLNEVFEIYDDEAGALSSFSELESTAEAPPSEDGKAEGA
jgi:anti-sigma B factor antagonist